MDQFLRKTIWKIPDLGRGAIVPDLGGRMMKGLSLLEFDLDSQLRKMISK